MVASQLPGGDATHSLAIVDFLEAVVGRHVASAGDIGDDDDDSYRRRLEPGMPLSMRLPRCRRICPFLTKQQRHASSDDADSTMANTAAPASSLARDCGSVQIGASMIPLLGAVTPDVPALREAFSLHCGAQLNGAPLVPRERAHVACCQLRTACYAQCGAQKRACDEGFK